MACGWLVTVPTLYGTLLTLLHYANCFVHFKNPSQYHPPTGLFSIHSSSHVHLQQATPPALPSQAQSSQMTSLNCLSLQFLGEVPH